MTALTNQRGNQAWSSPTTAASSPRNAMLAWPEENKIDWHFIAPGKPMQNGFFENLTAGCGISSSTKPCFFELDHTRDKIVDWVGDYDSQRPHSSLAAAA